MAEGLIWDDPGWYASVMWDKLDRGRQAWVFYQPKMNPDTGKMETDKEYMARITAKETADRRESRRRAVSLFKPTILHTTC